jgi:hypothetical protein
MTTENTTPDMTPQMHCLASGLTLLGLQDLLRHVATEGLLLSSVSVLKGDHESLVEMIDRSRELRIFRINRRGVEAIVCHFFGDMEIKP